VSVINWIKIPQLPLLTLFYSFTSLLQPFPYHSGNLALRKPVLIHRFLAVFIHYLKLNTNQANQDHLLGIL